MVTGRRFHGNFYALYPDHYQIIIVSLSRCGEAIYISEFVAMYNIYMFIYILFADFIFPFMGPQIGLSSSKIPYLGS